MAYPGSITAFSTMTSTNSPQAADLNLVARDIEAIGTALGSGWQDLDDTYVPSPTPSSVHDYVNMLMYIYKNMAGVSAWTQAAVPPRFMLFAHGGGQTVGGGGSSALYAGFGGLVSTAVSAYWPIPFKAKVAVRSLYIQTLTAGTGDQCLEVALYNRTVSQPPVIFYLPSISAPAGVYQSIVPSYHSSIVFNAGDVPYFLVVDNSTTGSGYSIGALAAEFDFMW